MGAENGVYLIEHFAYVEGLQTQLILAALDLAHIHYVIEQTQQILRRLIYLIKIVTQFIVFALAQHFPGKVCEACDGVHRRPYLVGHMGQEFSLCLAGILRELNGVFQEQLSLYIVCHIVCHTDVVRHNAVGNYGREGAAQRQLLTLCRCERYIERTAAAAFALEALHHSRGVILAHAFQHHLLRGALCKIVVFQPQHPLGVRAYKAESLLALGLNKYHIRNKGRHTGEKMLALGHLLIQGGVFDSDGRNGGDSVQERHIGICIAHPLFLFRQQQKSDDAVSVLQGAYAGYPVGGKQLTLLTPGGFIQRICLEFPEYDVI